MRLHIPLSALIVVGMMVTPSPAHAAPSRDGMRWVCSSVGGDYIDLGDWYGCLLADGSQYWCDAAGRCWWTVPGRKAEPPAGEQAPTEGVAVEPAPGAVVAIDFAQDMTLAHLHQVAELDAGLDLPDVGRVLIVEAQSLAIWQIDQLLAGRPADGAHLVGAFDNPSPNARIAEFATGRSLVIHRDSSVTVIILRR